MRYNTINFLTDFGLDDEFVGVVKSVMWSIAPEVHIVDVSHGIPAYNIRAGALALARSAPYLNPGVVVAVVDPGVGSSRRAVAVEVGDGASVLVGPDNGLLAPAVAMVGGATRAVDISHSSFRLDAPGPTFDGRDLFGPVGAQLCSGVPLEEVGSPIDPALLTPALVPVSASEGDAVIAEVLWIDRYGNAQLNLDPAELGEARYSVQIGEIRRPARRVTHFEELGPGELGVMADSSGMIALVLDRASAVAELGLGYGVEVRLHPGGEVAVSTPVTLGEAPT